MRNGAWTPNNNIIELEHVSKKYQLGEVWVTALGCISLRITSGEFLVVLGPSGSGKITLLNLIGALDTASSGDICMDGQHITRLNPSQCSRYRLETGKSAPNRPSYPGSAYGEWLVDVFDALSIEKAHMPGISRGGWLTLKIAIYAPERVNRIVPMSAQGLARLSVKFLLHSAPVILFPTERNNMNLVRFSTAPNLPLDQRWVERIRLIFKHYRSNRSRVFDFTDTELSQIRAPTLLLWGEYEGAYTVTKANARAARLIRDVRYEAIPNAGHTVSDDQPPVVNSRIVEFLNRHERRKSHDS